MRGKEQVPYEEAIRCPWSRGEHVGDKRGEAPAPRAPGVTRGSMLHTYVCVEPRCKGYDEIYIIQVMPDNTVWRVKHGKHDKAYPTIGGPSRDQKDAIDYLQREVDASTRPGGAEIR